MTTVLRALLFIALATLAGTAAPEFNAPATLRVVGGDHYPPYLFHDADGQLRGLVRDKWELWSRTTGVPVAIEAMDWADAQQRVLGGGADVIETLSFTEARARQYEFGTGSASGEASIFFHRTLGGIHDVASLRGLAVGMTSGSACGDWLRGHGVQLLRVYTGNQPLIGAAATGEIRLFCMDTAVARHLLVEAGVHADFKESPPLYSTTLDWAVKAGRGALRDFVQRGFARMPRSELEAIEARWLGRSVGNPLAGRLVRVGIFAATVVIAALVALLLRNLYLDRRARLLSTVDPVTSLPNRGAVHDHLARAIALAARDQRQLALLLVSVERHKAARDAYGQRFGDRILQEAAARLSREAAGAFAGFAGGEEFAIVLAGLERPEDALPIARLALAALEAPYDLDGARVYCGASAGIAVHPRDGGSAGDLLQNAGIALTHARQARGDGVQLFAPEMQANAAGRLQLETELRGALGRAEYVLYYQPRFESATGAVVGFEALLRWQHPARGLLLPAEFIGLLEETGDITAVGEWVFRHACEQLLEWERAGLQPLPIAVNLSARQFHDRGLDVAVKKAITETGVNAGLLELELTESSLMRDPEEAVRTLRHLESYGIKLSVDDFGTGYSSLAYLRRFPLDALKIDRSFVRDATTSPDDAAITKAIIQLAHTLGLRVVAEGVETPAQRDLLRSLDCDEVQGYLFGRPMPAAQAAALLPPCLSSLRSA